MSKLSIDTSTAADVEEDSDDVARETAGAVVEEGDAAQQAGKLPPRATLNADGSVTLKLVRPIALTIRSAQGAERTETYSELRFRELTGADLRLVAQEKDPMKATTLTLARATDMPAARMHVLFDRLTQRDVKGATDVIAYFQE